MASVGTTNMASSSSIGADGAVANIDKNIVVGKVDGAKVDSSKFSGSSHIPVLGKEAKGPLAQLFSELDPSAGDPVKLARAASFGMILEQIAQVARPDGEFVSSLCQNTPGL